MIVGETSTLTWSSTNATTCTASNGWSGTKATSGSEDIGPLNASATFTLACSGDGSSASDSVSITATTGLSGALLVTAISQVDSDSNDNFLAPVSNNSFPDAQSLPNPALLGGYVNQAGSGPAGPVMASGDVSDFYAVSLLENQVIELTVANTNPGVDDLDLELYSNGQILVDASIGIDRVERLVVPTSGDYYVRVVSFQGASNYILSIGQMGSTALGAPTLSSAFVPGEVLVKLVTANQRPGDTAAAQKLQGDVTRAYRLSRVGGGPDRELLLSVTPDTISELAKARPAIAQAIMKTRFASATDRRKWETLQLVKSLSINPAFSWAEPNLILSTHVVPNDPGYVRQRWHYELINLPAAWDVTTGSTSVIVAVVDSGVQPHLGNL
ncbi:MAG: hypothetical protein ACREVI_05510 [Steroidobacteraceae bacterium]